MVTSQSLAILNKIVTLNVSECGRYNLIFSNSMIIELLDFMG